MKTKKYSKEEADQKLPPPLWEYTKAPWYFGLAVKFFCRNPQLAMEVADVMNDKTNLPISRAEMKRQKQIGSAAARVQNDTATVAAPYTVPTASASASTSSSAGGISSTKETTLGQGYCLQGPEGEHKDSQEDGKDGGIGTGNESYWTII